MDLSKPSIVLVGCGDWGRNIAKTLSRLNVLKGIYKLNGDELIIKGIQLTDTLELKYKKQDKIKPKKWFW